MGNKDIFKIAIGVAIGVTFPGLVILAGLLYLF